MVLTLVAGAAQIVTDAPAGAVDFSSLPDAPTKILMVTPVEATAQKAAYCQVKGYVTPQVVALVRNHADM